MLDFSLSSTNNDRINRWGNVYVKEYTYNDGASHRIKNVPRSDAIVKRYKNKRSNTRATKPQSASSYTHNRMYKNIIEKCLKNEQEISLH